jgi:putative lipoprotein
VCLLFAALPHSAAAQLSSSDHPATRPAAAAERPARSLVLKPESSDSSRFFPTSAFAGRVIPTFSAPHHPAGSVPFETVRRGSSFNMPDDDPWLAFDKLQHFTFSFLITVGCQYGLVNKLSVSERRALPVSMITSATVGATKEYYDWRYGRTRTFSKRDMIANTAGILVAAGFILL